MRSSLSNENTGDGVVFIADRVMHYHVATLQAIEQRLASRGIPFSVLSAKDPDGAVGRVGLRGKVVTSHHHFRLTERKIGGFQIRYQHDLLIQLRRLNPKVVISMCHSGTISEWSMLSWAGSHGIKCVSWQCGYEYNPGRVKRFALRRFMPLFDYHLCYHSNAKTYSIRHGALAQQTLVMHNTIDESKIVVGDQAAAKATIGLQWPIINKKKIILYVGAILEEKRLDTVFAALDLLANHSIVFLVVGDGPYLPVLRDRYGNRNDWLAVGNIVAGVGDYFDAADVFVLPGTGGLAINEAMAHRRPVVAGYADGSADDLVVDGETGFRLRTDDPSELADRLSQLLADPKRAAEMGEKGEALIRGQLSFEYFIDRVVGVLTEQHELAMAI